MDKPHWFKDHEDIDTRRFDIQGADLKEIKNDVKIMKENHLSHIELALAQVTTDVAWLKKSYWVVVSASVGALIVALINLVIKIK